MTSSLLAAASVDRTKHRVRPITPLKMWLSTRSGFLIGPYASSEEAEAMSEKLVRWKLKRGYVVVEEKGGTLGWDEG